MAGLVDFNGADTDPLPSPFVSVTGWGNLRRVSNQCGNSAGSDTDAAMRRNDSTATLSQLEYRSGTFDGGPAFLDVLGNGYVATSYSGVHVELYRVTAGPNYTKIGGDTSVTFTAGDTAALELDGNDIVFYKNSVETKRETDSTFRTGLTPAVFCYADALRIDNHTDGAAGGQDITVGLASETDTAFAVGKFKSKAAGLASETDTAFQVAMVGSIIVGLASETDTAFSVSKFKSKAVGLATETDTAFSATPGLDLPTSYFTDFPDTENPIDQDSMFRVGDFTGFYKNPRSTPGKCFAADFVGAGFDDCLAHLINHDISVDHRISATVFRQAGYDDPDETHEFGLYARHVIGVGVDEEFVRGIEVIFEAGASSIQVVRWEGTEHDITNFFTGISVTGGTMGILEHGDVVAVQVIGDEFEVFLNGVSFATFTDSTFADGNPGMGFFVRSGDTTLANFGISTWEANAAGTMVSVGLASETDTAFSVGKRKLHSAGLCEETDSAFSVTRRKTRAIGLASETDTSLAARPLRSYTVGLSLETDSAFTVSRRKRKAVGLALEVDGAFGVIGGQESTGGGYRSNRLGLGFG